MLLSGPVGAGKSTLARRLSERFGATHIVTRDLMKQRAQAAGKTFPDDRAGLQKVGEELDKATCGAWVADDLAAVLLRQDRDALVVIDAVRIASQVEAVRTAFGRDVVHVHIHAPRDTLMQRYEARRSMDSEIVELSSYEDVERDPTEARIGDLKRDADVVIDSQQSSPADVEVRAAAKLGLFGSSLTKVDVIIGGQFGSEGKGNIAFYMARDYDLLVRVGGPNAGHTVPLPTPFTHRLLPSGTRANESAHLLIGPGAVLDLDVILKEIGDCQVEVDRLSIDPNAMMISPEDIKAEGALVEKIGSTGRGVGAATARRIMGRAAVCPPVQLASDVTALRPYIRSAEAVLGSAYKKGDRILLEGTQGTGLSLYHGPYPHVTSRDTTVAGCLAEAGIAPLRVGRVVLVCRTYPIRVQNGSAGTSGPMSQEISLEYVANRSGIPLQELEETEKGSVSGKQRRVSEFDWVQLRRAVELNGATDIALTFADYLDIKNRNARRFDQLTQPTMQFIEEIEQVAGIPVSLIATRFEARSVIDRRQW